MFEKIYAQTPMKLGSSITGEGLGPFAKVAATAQSGLLQIATVVSSIIGVMTIAAGIWFLFNFIIGGIQWISSGGDKHGLETAQQRITNAFIGLVIVVAGWTILALASRFLGVDFILAHPETVITNLQLK